MSIARIEVFSNQQEQGDAVIQGLRINYNLSDATTHPIDHGLVNIDKVGDATICGEYLQVMYTVCLMIIFALRESTSCWCFRAAQGSPQPAKQPASGLDRLCLV